MKLPKRNFLIRSTNGILVTFLAIFVFAPAQAHAECGDYVMIGGKAARDSHAMPTHGNAPRFHERSPGVPRDGRAPCSGPLCSRQAPPTAPVPTAPAPLRNPNETCGYTPATQDSADSDSSYLVHDLITAQPLHCHLAIYHPPR
ncbi:MAG TPA: hypothetical protein VGY66_34150 [Gemmataceae bacterium]|jgi:hypothetical protein|nr:hypothetical protein [Gemmataceae bacterium]